MPRRIALAGAALALLLVVLLIVASAIARALPAPLAAGQVRVEQIDTSAYPEISLFVSATDAAGRPRSDLDAVDFAITEDGVAVPLKAFAGGGPVSSVLVIDRSGSMEEAGKIEGARAAAEAFVARMRPQDQAALIAFNDDVRLVQGFTDDADELRAVIERLRADNGTALYDAVVAGVDLLREQQGRRLLVVLSDGQDCSVPFDNCPDSAGSSISLVDAIAYAEAAGQPVVVVGLGDTSASGNDGIDEAVLGRIANETGGRYLYAPRADELATLYTDLAGAVQQEYRLSYVSPRPSYDGTRRDIAVNVGGVAAAGSYTERHLINVVSRPLVGLVLLLPLAGLLALPAALRRHKRRTATVAGSYQPEGAPPVLMTSAGSRQPTAPADAATLVVGARFCMHCGATLRASARFCTRCGAAQGEQS